MKKRPEELKGSTRFFKTGCGKLYVTINEEEAGIPFEIFVSLGKSGGCGSAQNEALGRILSWGLRSGADIEDIRKSLKGITCLYSDKDLNDEASMFSCPHAIGLSIEYYLENKTTNT